MVERGHGNEMDAESGELGEAELGELAAFADGSLAPGEHARVAARIERSPRLQALMAEQRASIAAVAVLDVSAPERLRTAVTASVEATPPPSPAGRRFRLPRLAFAGGLATSLTAAAIAVVIAVVGGGALTIADTAELAGRGASASAPAVDPDDPRRLVASVAGVAFPNYPEDFGWQVSGERADELDGRGTRTVFYRRGNQEVAYSIVDGDPLAWPSDVRLANRAGVELRAFEHDGSSVVTWLRDGHTCVISSKDIGTDELLDLAAWSGEDGTSA